MVYIILVLPQNLYIVLPVVILSRTELSFTSQALLVICHVLSQSQGGHLEDKNRDTCVVPYVGIRFQSKLRGQKSGV